MQQHSALRARCLGTLVATLAIASSADGQSFGRNKVHYKERDGAADVARMAERWYERLSTILRHSLSRRQPIVPYASQPDFQQTNVVTGEIGEGTGGVTEGLKQRVVLPLTGALAETDHVLGHELVHAFQYDLARRRNAPGEDNAGGSSLDRLPLWFVEGMAEYLSIGPVDPHTAMWLRDAARYDVPDQSFQLRHCADRYRPSISTARP
ncbi:MAG: hypothetical protein HOP16_03270 [Acidobacteria bacterium]|nr:hypothetical protein [Acidobacteriota bacterium]